MSKQHVQYENKQHYSSITLPQFQKLWSHYAAERHRELMSRSLEDLLRFWKMLKL